MKCFVSMLCVALMMCQAATADNNFGLGYDGDTFLEGVPILAQQQTQICVTMPDGTKKCYSSVQAYERATGTTYRAPTTVATVTRGAVIDHSFGLTDRVVSQTVERTRYVPKKVMRDVTVMRPVIEKREVTVMQPVVELVQVPVYSACPTYTAVCPQPTVVVHHANRHVSSEGRHETYTTTGGRRWWFGKRMGWEPPRQRSTMRRTRRAATRGGHYGASWTWPGGTQSSLRGHMSNWPHNRNTSGMSYASMKRQHDHDHNRIGPVSGRQIAANRGRATPTALRGG